MQLKQSSTEHSSCSCGSQRALESMLTFRTAGEGTSSDEPPLVLQEKGGVPRNPTWDKTDEDIQEKGPTQLD